MDLRKQLALAVRSIQWSYAIFWSISSRQPRVLEWGDGYYNGEIKTRKTVQRVETAAHQLGLQRSDQLRELYESLSLDDNNAAQSRRPMPALSPEDLTDAEWYFFVCMSFAFNDNQGLPGRTFARDQTIWLCNAHCTDTKVFSRSLLAKSASIQTIVCFPHFGGVVELGTAEPVPEDLDLIQSVKSLFLGCSSATASKTPNSVVVDDDHGHDHDRMRDVLGDANVPEDGLDQLLDCPGVDISSPNDCSKDFTDTLLSEEPNLMEGIDGEASHIENSQFIDDMVSNCLINSGTLRDYVSQTYGDTEAIIPTLDGNELNGGLRVVQGDTEASIPTMDGNELNGGLRVVQEGCRQNTSGFQGNENHYHNVLSNLLKSSHQLTMGAYFRNGCQQSRSFIGWRRDRSPGVRVPYGGTHQRLLKKALFEVARMHQNLRLESCKQKGNAKPEANETDRNHVLSERKRREKINERFAILGSLVPSGGKVDKVSILDHTIGYLRKLERKIEDLESIERTSNSYGRNKTGNAKKQSANKRKACDTYESWRESSRIHLEDPFADSLTVNVSDKSVLIEIQCCWKDFVMIDIMEAISKLRMESETVQSSNTDGILSMIIKAKSKRLKAASENMIRQALLKVIRNK